MECSLPQLPPSLQVRSLLHLRKHPSRSHLWHATHAITVRLAALRAGCSADTSFTVEMTRAGTKAWRAVATDASVTI